MNRNRQPLASLGVMSTPSATCAAASASARRAALLVARFSRSRLTRLSPV
jgi:hypothetical protein